MEQSQLTYIPFSSIIDLGFWTTLSKVLEGLFQNKKKIEEYKLDDTPQRVWGKYKSNPHAEKFSHLNFDIYSFNEPTEKSGPFEVHVDSHFTNFNTIESYRNVQSGEYLRKQVKLLHEDIKSGNQRTVRANLLMFADLKKYLFTYRLLVPTMKIDNVRVLSQSKLSDVFKDSGVLLKLLKNYINTTESNQQISKPYLFINNNLECTTVSQVMDENNYAIYFDSHNQDRVCSAFQNFLAYLIENKVTQVKVCVIKDSFTYTGQKFELKNSKILHLDLQDAKVSLDESGNPIPSDVDHYSQEKVIDLKGFMDEKILAREAVDLNIKLMKWRMLPNVDLELIKSTKCILFGSGTLGCQLARNLIGWGVRHITFVDYGRVSYSNPVRQSLFDFEDSCNGGRWKAETAAERLKKIFPDIVTEGITIEIPMPGHYVGEAQVQSTCEAIQTLDALVASHDAVFLLTDSRESRWFPTLLANKHQKISFAVALGFDSFCVIRQGASVLKHDPQVHGDRLGCYFCNDVSAPQDSMKDRTLDQQCTVTRPGLSFLASAYASELLVSLIQHPMREAAPASDETSELQCTDLGLLPHFLRGSLSDFDVKIFYGRSYKNCVACSQSILDEYLNKGEEFIIKIMNQPDHLQEVSGIAASLNLLQPYGQIEIIDDDFAIIQ